MSFDKIWLCKSLLSITLQELQRNIKTIFASYFFFIVTNLFKQVSGVLGDEIREHEFISHDLAVHFLHVLGVERRQSSQHFVQQRSKAPPINCLSISMTHQHLRCEVFWGTAEGFGSVVGIEESLLAETEISHAYVSLISDEKVLGLQVAIDNTSGVEVFESKDDFSSIEANSVFSKAFLTLEMVEELTAVNVVEDEVEFVFGLERIVETNKERMVKL